MAIVCELCKMEHPSFTALDKHLSKHKSLTTKCDYYNKYYDSIECEICGKSFPNIKALLHHVKKHSDVITPVEYHEKYLSDLDKCAYERCGKSLVHERYGKYCCQGHAESQERLEKYGHLDWECSICGWGTTEDPEEHFNLAGKIAMHLTRFHNFDKKQMEEFYNKNIKKDDDPDGHCLWCGKDLEFRNLTEGYSKFCYNTSCNVLWYNKNTDRKENASQSTKETYAAEPERLATRKEYWMAKGFSEEESINKVSERQSTFTLEKCIEKLGKVEGTKRWQERQDLWLSNYKRNNFSMVSQRLFWGIYEEIGDKWGRPLFATMGSDGNPVENQNNEFRLKTTKTSRLLDFYIPSLKKCIEFDGTYWHGDVGRGNRTRDEDRDVEINNEGISVFHIKERDYKEDPDREILRCLEFLNEGRKDNPIQEIG